jgi:simple sugar transport system permease protein
MTWVAKNRTTLILLAVVAVLAYVFYIVANDIAPSMFVAAWGYAIPLVLASLVGVIGERSGVVNIGIEGQMLIAAFAGFFAAAYSGSMLVGVLAGVGSGLIAGGFLAWTTVRWRMDQIIAGVVLNIVATGITSFYYTPGQILPGVIPNLDIPLLQDIPLVGEVFFSGRSWIASFAIIAAVGVHLLLFHTRWGLRTRAVGEYPSAADTAGVNVERLRLVNVTLAGTLAGLAGVYLSMDASSSFERGMTAGRGFLALAIMIMGAWRPLRAFAMALFFGFINAVASQLQQSGLGVEGDPSGFLEWTVDALTSPQILATLPYVAVLVVLGLAAGRVRAPGAVGQPYVKGDQ